MILTVAVAFLLGLIGAWLAISMGHVERKTPQRTVRLINEQLPQTQCRKCGYDGCSPYAEAIVYENESIDLCPPGGAVTRRTLARMMGRDPDIAPGDGGEEVKRTAVVVEVDCIGCTKCIQVCPVDAIIGASGKMHTVVSNLCTGCDLCAPVCPTDCIEMQKPKVRIRPIRASAPLAA